MKIKVGEDESYEFKLLLNYDSKKWLKTVVGFLNNGFGGNLYFGIRDDGEMVGLEFFQKDQLSHKQASIMNPIHFCSDEIFKCVDRTIIYISNEISKNIYPYLLPFFYKISLRSKDPYIIELRVKPTREIIYSLVDDQKNKYPGSVYLRDGSQTIKLKKNEINVLEKNREKEVNYSYLQSNNQSLSFVQLYNHIKTDQSYKQFVHEELRMNGFLISTKNTWNYEAFLLSDRSEIKTTINNFSNHLEPEYNNKQTIIWNQSLLMHFLKIHEILEPIWYLSVESDLLKAAIWAVLMQNEYFDFSNNGPVIEVFEEYINLKAFVKSEYTFFETLQKGSNKYPHVKLLLKKYFPEIAAKTITQNYLYQFGEIYSKDSISFEIKVPLYKYKKPSKSIPEYKEN
ncbi:helix-turn-helix domain-containing protein [Mycoplasmopsis agassizii]|uniref:ATP-binding protein n=1 Tax=Mycoplasmopsis agassizii TaxID=33922 RepID=A0ABX4H4M0_9BACT|nr:ATP-binding protein [Mycoplasmopsis agassizii]PAF54843.1 ATP-binding protein [Mycoplasmopsis agassizii]SMC18610.1 Putative DNA-binding domain-containing protein [Mycoplasmopsis agassizii]